MRLTVNGKTRDLAGDPSRTLLSVLRDELWLTGTKPACGEGTCGACTVLVDGAPIRSCVTALDDVVGRSITTIEDLAGSGTLSPVQRALLAECAFQCGYCTPGVALSITALIEQDPDPDSSAISAALDGHICRCGSYPRMRRAIELVRSPAIHDVEGNQLSAASPRRDIEPVQVPWDRHALEERDYFDALGDGLVVVLPAPKEGSDWAGAWTTSGGVWLHVGSDGSITGFTGKVEMGQNITTALTLIVAEALAVRASAVRMVMADTDLCPYDRGTVGSRSIADAGAMLRAAAWRAVEVIVRLAADRLEAHPGDLIVRDGAVGSRDAARRIRYADLLHGVRQLETIEDRPTRPPAVSDWVAAPLEQATESGVAAVTGQRVFATDIRVPHMLAGRELAPPVAGARLASLDLTPLHGRAGVTVVREGDFVGVVAADDAAAERGVRAIRADWTVDTSLSSADLIDHLESQPIDDASADDRFEHDSGDVDAALARGSVVRQRYTTALVAHVPLETRVAVASWAGDRLTVWTATQSPFWAREQLAEALGLAEDRVRVIVPPLGAGFGGKHAAGPGVAAARLSRAAGYPVRVRWRHADEFVWGHVRPAAVVDIAAAVAAADLSINAWDVANLNGGSSAIQPPYRIANQRLRYRPCELPLRQSSYRALGATANTFARESMIDELANRVGADSLEFRLRNVDDERLAEVLQVAARRAGWRGAAAEKHHGHGQGIAGAVEKDARVASCAEVSVDRRGRVQIERITTAFECGAIIDADNLANQIEGATVMALGPALFEAVELDRGRVATSSLATYRVPRFSDAPAIEVVLVDRRDLPSAGGGEVPLIALAPAVANAIHSASGVRLRSMPLIPGGSLPPSSVR
jgi:CO/xanthine dehydrogenase Mo-binding subunit/aerobic-type carbon monoxide dehydrogenase small subunit (CoxS/CutS family)